MWGGAGRGRIEQRKWFTPELTNRSASSEVAHCVDDIGCGSGDICRKRGQREPNYIDVGRACRQPREQSHGLIGGQKIRSASFAHPSGGLASSIRMRWLTEKLPPQQGKSTRTFSVAALGHRLKHPGGHSSSDTGCMPFPAAPHPVRQRTEHTNDCPPPAVDPMCGISKTCSADGHVSQSSKNQG